MAAKKQAETKQTKPVQQARKPRQKKEVFESPKPEGETPHWWFKPGNDLWKLNPKLSELGKERKYTPEQLYAKIQDYFDWIKANPILELKAFASQGEVIYATLPKPRAMTIQGLAVFLNIVPQTWREWRATKAYPAIQDWAESVIYEQKFSGAAAGVLNASIVARDLGLVEKVQTEQSGEVKYIVENAPDGMDE